MGWPNTTVYACETTGHVYRCTRPVLVIVCVWSEYAHLLWCSRVMSGASSFALASLAKSTESDVLPALSVTLFPTYPPIKREGGERKREGREGRERERNGEREREVLTRENYDLPPRTMPLPSIYDAPLMLFVSSYGRYWQKPSCVPND